MDQKHCKQCGEILQRKRYGRRLEGLKAFNGRSFCSVSCSARHRESLKKGTNGTEAGQQIRQAVEGIKSGSEADFRTALEILREIANTSADETTRLNAAKALAPYETPKATVRQGKKEGAAERASKAAKGKFSSGMAPVLPLRRN